MITARACKHCNRTFQTRVVTENETDYRYSLCPHCDYASCLQCGRQLGHTEMVCASCQAPV